MECRAKSLVYVQDSYSTIAHFLHKSATTNLNKNKKKQFCIQEGQRWGMQVMEKEYITIISEALVPTRIYSHCLFCFTVPWVVQCVCFDVSQNDLQ